MSDVAIKFDNVSKLYELGTVGTGTMSHDLKRWWITSVLHKEDPYLKIGEINDRSTKGDSKFVYALKDIDFEVKQGDVLGIIGKNGAGKSTLLKLLSRVTAPTTGKIYTKGRIASLLEVGTGFHPELTGRENIYMNGTIMGMKKWEIDLKLDEIVDFSGCERYLDTPVKRYSSGMMVRLGFAVAAHLEPEILVVDEVLAVGDAEFQKKAIGKMQDVSKGEGRTVLFVSHNMGAVRNLCTKGIVLQNGMHVFDGTTDEAVDRYISEKGQNQETKCNIATVENADKTKEMVILSIELEKEQNTFNVQDSITFIVTVLANRNVSCFRVNTTISNLDDSPIGSVSSRSFFSIKEGEIKRVKLTIYDINLAPGTYSSSFSIGIGNFEVGQRDFDCKLNALNFTISNFDTGEKALAATQWERSWGSIMIPYRQIIVE